MSGTTGWRRFSPSRWAGEIGNWRERRAERLAASSQEALGLAEQRLAKSLKKDGPESWRSINAMEAVAKFNEALSQFSEALPLREQVVDLRRRLLGRGHQLTIAAEARLAVTFIELHRPKDAKPLLVHVLKGLTAAEKPDDLTVLAVTKRLAEVEAALGESEDARRLLEEEMAHYVERGDELLASGVTMKLAEVLIRDGDYAEAPELLRNVVEVRSRLLGMDDPETLTALRNLTSSLVWTKDFAEASIVARNLLATMRRVKGSEDPDTLDTERLVANIDGRLSSG